MGIFTLLITILAFSAGTIRSELVLMLVGTVFLLTLGACFLGVLVLSVLLSKKARTASVRILNKQVPQGGTGTLSFELGPAYSLNGRNKRFFRFPGILLRYEMSLVTKDGRTIHHSFDPDALLQGLSVFPVPERGAYYSVYDGFIIADAPGFFYRSIPIPQDSSPRLLVSPGIAETCIPLHIHPGGTLQQQRPHFLRSDNLIDHRPYMPGDDPRRLNWKLYGHAGDLFVREGEPEPPPHSRLLILVDTQSDDALYTPQAACRGVDLLCENAMALAIGYADRGMDLSIGYTGGEIHEGSPGELAVVLAYPAALPLSGPEALPIPEDTGILILALPRSLGIESALDRFLQQRGARQGVDIVFLYEGSAYEAAAANCISSYRPRGFKAHGRQGQ
jgi:hypothetical protein